MSLTEIAMEITVMPMAKISWVYGRIARLFRRRRLLPVE
jgi:hypothetical protein